MKHLAVFLSALMCLAGCGGSSGSSGGVVNVFAGTWTGPWQAGSDKGTATLHITGVNSIAGTIVDTTTNQTYQVTGTIETPGLNSTKVELTESNNGNLVVFSGTITKSVSLTSFTGTLTDIANNGDIQTITLSYSGT